MNRPVKLQLAVIALFVAGCSFSARAPVGTTEITSAEIEREDVPRVGKPQRGEADASDILDKDPERHEKRPGGGFSGYK